MNAVFFLLGDFPASEFYVQTFGTLCWNSVFRNVGAENSDAKESPKIKKYSIDAYTSETRYWRKDGRDAKMRDKM